MTFPKNFTWGAATASYQIEGAAHEDGRGPSIWDTFAATPGKVFNGDNGDVACDHYHRVPQDIEIMKDLGIDSYRFSIAWPRLAPQGDSQREQRGYDFYSRLIDQLLEAGIKPLPTMYHWDLPQALQDKGGWANRDTAYRFAVYAADLAEAYSDRVDKWITFNEPWCFTWLGYMSGVHAPGVKDMDQAIAAAHHSALAHAEGIRAVRAINPNVLLGQTLNMTNYIVSDPSDANLMELASLQDSHINRWWIDAEQTGHYPENLVEYYGPRLDRVLLPGDEKLLKIDTDFLGINYYSDSFLGTPDEDTRPIIEGGLFPFPQRTKDTPPSPQTDMGWPITPEGLHDLVLRVARDWPELGEIIITENGAAYPEGPDADGEVHDQRRIDYLTSHLEALGRACEEGAPVSRYYAWSLMDNFEWAEGYAKRFGLIHVDFDTLVRTPKQSARVYATIIETNGESLKAVSV